MLNLLSLFVLLCGVSTIIAQSVPVLPSKDSFYTPPASWKTAVPGQLLRTRIAPGNLTSTFGNASQVYDVLFRSIDTNYKPTWGFTTVFIPKSSVNKSAHALLSYQIPYNTPDVDAGPTTLLYANMSDLGIIGTDIDTALSRGWVVSVPDHEGPHASFICGVQEGHATLDSIRAVLSHFRGHELAKDSKTALWGYSGGSLASEFAAELQVQYAPELKLAGAALGGVVTNISASLANLPSTQFAGLVPAGLVGYATQHPLVARYLLSELKPSGPYNATAFLAVKNLSINEAFAVYADQNTYNYFRSGEAFFDAPVLQNALARDAIMGAHGIPRIPLFMYKAVGDEITDVADTDKQVAQYCANRANIVYERNSIGGHVAEETNGDARALEWLSTVLEGHYIHTGCTIRNVAINVTDSPA